ncbi:MAG: hypothetical protein AAF611_13810 [Bacteroidota bacterium]
MKRQTIKNLTFNKKTISTFTNLEDVKGGIANNTSHTSCLCMYSLCECKKEDEPLRHGVPVN